LPAESDRRATFPEPGARGEGFDIGQPAAGGTGDTAFTRAGALTYGFNVLTLLTNVVTGVLTARVLGTGGRGELVAILTFGGMLAWASAMGGQQAASYHQARHPEEGGRLVATWLLVLIPVGVVAVIAGQLLVPVLLAAQTEGAHDLARLFVLTAVLVVLWEFLSGVILGDHDFLRFNLVLFAQPAATAAAYVALWPLGLLTVESALAVWALAYTGAVVAVAPTVLRRHGLGRPSLGLARSTLSYGVRAHGTRIGGLANQRLDLLIIPAFVSASQVGLYSVATNVSFAVVTLAGALYPLVLPAAARQGARGARTVVLSLHVTLAVALALALGVGLFAEAAVRLLYGAAFADSALPLRLLLPGSALYAAARVLASGLYAANRPFTAALTEAAGFAVTLVGLLLFLERWGITAAAVVTTVAYTVVFVSALFLYRRAAGLGWGDFLPSAGEVSRGLRAAFARRGTSA
jgi:O-antigen/teichoic acid export membrane protein